MAETRQQKAKRTLEQWSMDRRSRVAPVAKAQEASSVQGSARASPLTLQSPRPGSSNLPARSHTPGDDSDSAQGDAQGESPTSGPSLDPSFPISERPFPAGSSSSLLPALRILPPTPARDHALPSPDNAFPSNFRLLRSPSAASTSPPVQSDSRRPLHFVEQRVDCPSGTFHPAVTMRPPSRHNSPKQQVSFSPASARADSPLMGSGQSAVDAFGGSMLGASASMATLGPATGFLAPPPWQSGPVSGLVGKGKEPIRGEGSILPRSQSVDGTDIRRDPGLRGVPQSPSLRDDCGGSRRAYDYRGLSPRDADGRRRMSRSVDGRPGKGLPTREALPPIGSFDFPGQPPISTMSAAYPYTHSHGQVPLYPSSHPAPSGQFPPSIQFAACAPTLHSAGHYPPTSVPPFPFLAQHPSASMSSYLSSQHAPYTQAAHSHAAVPQSTHSFNVEVVNALCSGWPVCVPLALFGSLYNNSSLGSTPDYGSALHLINVGNSIGLKHATRFKDYPVADISEKEWSIISVNMPRMIAEEFIPSDETDVGSDTALGVAQMFATFFHSIQARPDFNIAFGQYKEYADQGYKFWHAYPSKEINLSYFNERKFQEVLNFFQTVETANAKAATAASSSATASSSRSSQGSLSTQPGSSACRTQRGDRSESF
ncbi:hypothetical protein BDP27DRAFT_1426839 [Rhodocollybia butyracea]|uniref:Uncharacterized protein n=1 Tax=Rhodocollybia butyracea TaxID=206335 RepID=A0A9P5PHJ1_9AGAR|nr:hypothetical protein BDP27DRAFT_1426839 [Rhodocollybia butyracea]